MLTVMSTRRKLRQAISPIGLSFATVFSAAVGVHAAEQDDLSTLKAPHLTLGNINKKETKRFLTDLKNTKKRIGKGARIYVHINSNGGSVKEGWKIYDALNSSYHAGYNIRLVCQKAFSMAGVIFAGFEGNRFALENCQLMTHASYFSKIEYWEVPPSYFSKIEDWRIPSSFTGTSVLRIPFNVGKITLDSPDISEAQAEELREDRDEFAKSLNGRSCKITFNGALGYFKTADKDISLKEALAANIVDDVIKINAQGHYEINYAYRDDKDNCTPGKLNIVPSRR